VTRQVGDPVTDPCQACANAMRDGMEPALIMEWAAFWGIGPAADGCPACLPDE
jgi:hypothetical protein